MAKRAIVIASDTHAGGSTSLCPDEDIHLDDGGFYKPSKTQRWLNAHWHSMWKEWMPQTFEEHGVVDWMFVHNGDMFEGDHHSTYQLMTRHPGAQFDVARKNMEVPLSMDPNKILIVRGTASHNGKGNSMEEAMGSFLHGHGKPVIKTEDDKYAHWHYRTDVWGTRFDFTHHGRTSGRAWTFKNAVNNLAADIALSSLRDDEPYPHYAIRSHFHRENDSYDAQPVRVIQTPAWQTRTEYVWKVVPETVADIGLIMVICSDDGSSRVEKNIIKVKRDRARIEEWK